MLRLALGGVVLAIALLAAAGPAAPVPEAVKPPTSALCKPATIRMEYFSSLGGKLGEYDAHLQGLVKVDAYNAKCLWVASGPTDEAFVAFVGYVPPRVPGRIASGDCDRTRPDSPPFYHSRKRYLDVSGGNRKDFQNAVGGNENILKGVLAAAEAAGVGQACPGKTPPPTPPPPPPPSGSKADQLGIDYSMPDRFGKTERNGIIHYPDPGEIAPKVWEVDLTVRRKDGKPCVDGDLLAVSVDGKPLTQRRLVRGDPCEARILFPDEGVYRVRARLRTKGGKTLSGERTVVVQDWLIVGLGDSNGSGEGTPDRPTQTPGRNPGLATWQSRKCDRSANSYQAQTALDLERRDPRTSVTFVHLACSGAAILKGLLGGYEGITGGSLLPPQVDEMKRLAAGREIDAVLVSIGINDLGFAKLVGHCIAKQGCASAPYPDDNSPTTLDDVMQKLLATMPVRYELLAEALSQQRIPSKRVYITEYFDSTRDERRDFCNPLIATPKGTFTRAEAKWAHDRILVPLNAAVAAAAGEHKWRLVSGSYDQFGPHGYCSNNRWIVRLTDSFLRQGNENGTLHANPEGNRVQAGNNVRKIRPDFYANGRTRRPR